MNKARKTELRRIYAVIRDAKDDLESVKFDEQNALDSIPENLQNTERAEAMEEAIDNMDSAEDALAEALDYLSDYT